MTTKTTGLVKWFNSEIGVGVITPESGGEELFVHFTGISNGVYRTLYESQRVEFSVVNGGNGPTAINVVSL